MAAPFEPHLCDAAWILEEVRKGQTIQVSVLTIDTNPPPAFTRSSRNAARFQRLLPGRQAPRHEAVEFGVATPLKVGHGHGLPQSKTVRTRHIDTLIG